MPNAIPSDNRPRIRQVVFQSPRLCYGVNSSEIVDAGMRRRSVWLVNEIGDGNQHEQSKNTENYSNLQQSAWRLRLSVGFVHVR